VAQAGAAAIVADREEPTRDAAIIVGQALYARPAVEHRGVLALLLPGVRMSAPTVHEHRAGSGRKLPGSRRAHTGLLHMRARDLDIEAIVEAAHQRAYYDEAGVWLAADAEAARELAAWELVMRHYRNGVPTGLAMSPITVERARTSFGF
jgi:hypothetical protein